MRIIHHSPDLSFVVMGNSVVIQNTQFPSLSGLYQCEDPFGDYMTEELSIAFDRDARLLFFVNRSLEPDCVIFGKMNEQGLCRIQGRVRQWVAERRRLALAMVFHPRLGKGSGIRSLGEDIVPRLIK